MPHIRSQHPNAPLTPEGSRRRSAVFRRATDGCRDRRAVPGRRGRRCGSCGILPCGGRNRVLRSVVAAAAIKANTLGNARPATGTSTPPSMTGPASCTPRSWATRRTSPPPGFGPAPPPSTSDWDHPSPSAQPQPTRPDSETNGKVERFHRILLEEWAYIRPPTSETQRSDA